jgi:hypothetical protein
LLSDPVQRKAYDRRHGFTYNRHAPPPTVPIILAEVIALRKYVESLNLHSLDHEALSYHLKKLLTHQRIEILKQNADEHTLSTIRDEIIKASTHLRYSLLEDSLDPLFELLKDRPGITSPLVAYASTRKQTMRIQKATPWLVLLITLLLCFGIFSSNS